MPGSLAGRTKRQRLRFSLKYHSTHPASTLQQAGASSSEAPRGTGTMQVGSMFRASAGKTNTHSIRGPAHCSRT